MWYLSPQSSHAELPDLREAGGWGVSSCQSAKKWQSLIFDSEAIVYLELSGNILGKY